MLTGKEKKRGILQYFMMPLKRKTANEVKSTNHEPLIAPEAIGKMYGQVLFQSPEEGREKAYTSKKGKDPETSPNAWQGSLFHQGKGRNASGN